MLTRHIWPAGAQSCSAPLSLIKTLSLGPCTEAWVCTLAAELARQHGSNDRQHLLLQLGGSDLQAWLLSSAQAELGTPQQLTAEAALLQLLQNGAQPASCLLGVVAT